MVYIKKGPTPDSLRAFQRQADASYDSPGFPRDDVYEALLKEQGGICAYCMCRIRLPKDVTPENRDQTEIHIEHWIPQSGEAYKGYYTQEECDKLAIDYRNMLGVCPGGRKKSHQYSTCDTHRGNAHIVLNPQDERMIDTLYYCSDGQIKSTDCCIDKNLGYGKLNLNTEQLKSNRKSAIDSCKRVMLKQRANGKWTRSMIEKQIAHYEGRDEDGNRYPFAGAVLYWLKKHRGKL